MSQNINSPSSNPSHQQTRNLILGITGGIAAYKAAEVARTLVKHHFNVKVVMTRGAQAFITPLTLQSLTGEAVHTELLSTDAESTMDHISLARWANYILICPASAHFLAKIAHGLCDDLLSTLCIATTAPITLAPAMNQAMWQNPATQHNVWTVQQRGIKIIPPKHGEQACGETGPGRLPEPKDVVEQFLQHHTRITPKPTSSQTHFSGPTSPLFSMTAPPSHQSPHWVITAGPTQEPLDPVRFLSNRSSGKMGYALAEAAASQGAQVTLISGPTALSTPPGVRERLDITTAQDMLDAVLKTLTHQRPDVYISAAAIADYRALTPAQEKIKKQDEETLTLQLTKNPDVLSLVAQHAQRPTLVVGFAAETQHIHQFAREKLIRKQLDIIIANDVSQPNIGFDSDYNQVQIIEKCAALCLGPASKRELAQRLCHEIHLRWLQKSALPSPYNHS